MTTDARRRQKDALDRKIRRCRECTDMNEPGVTEAAPGFGSIDSPVAIVGEALCRACMDHQEPFYGGSGRVLDRCYKRAGVAKTDLFITNSIHCPPRRSRPTPTREHKNCLPFLREELREIVQPRVVIGVGKFAKTSLMWIYPEARGAELAVSSTTRTSIRPAGPAASLVPAASLLEHDPLRTRG